MAHLDARTGYDHLIGRLNRFPQGAPDSKSLRGILGVLMSEREASLVARLPIKPFTAARAARIWKMKPAEAQKILDRLASRCLLLDTTGRTRDYYILPPPMAGFFEFSLMRLRGDIDQKLLAELFHQYINVEEDFITALFGMETKLGRAFVHEPVLTAENALHTLDYERGSEVIKTAPHRGVGLCYCRHKMGHMGKACAAPLDICMTFGNTAASLIKHGYARSVDVKEGLDLLQQAYNRNLVQFGENVRREVSFICNCCGCCCEALIAARRLGSLRAIHTTNFIPRIDRETCSGCGECAVICPVEAMGLVSANDPGKPRKKTARVDESICIGCGICARACKTKSLGLVSRPVRVITPLDSVHKAVLMAIEKGTLQDLIFDNRALRSHRAMAAILGVILRMPPLKQALASKQMKSRYLEALILRMKT
jgi:Pyruvate/2-oxoacid:ferredoxin oxidoreductase delta subunit